ncbi:hypothetical protein [Psittacicella hinzii]
MSNHKEKNSAITQLALHDPEVSGMNLRWLEKGLANTDIFVTGNSLLQQQIREHMQHLPGVRVQPKFFSLPRLMKLIQTLFLKKLNQKELSIKQFSPTLAPLLKGRFKNFLDPNGQLNLLREDLEITSISNQKLLWLTIEYLQKTDDPYVQALLQSAALYKDNLFPNLKEQENLKSANYVENNVYFVAKTLNSFASKLYGEYPEFILDLMYADFGISDEQLSKGGHITPRHANQSFKDFMQKHFVEAVQNDLDLQSQVLFMQQVVHKTSSYALEQLSQQSTNFRDTKKVYLTQLEALTLIAESEFEATDKDQEPEHPQRVFIIDAKIYSPRDLIVLKKVAKYCHFDVLYFVNTVTPHLFATIRRKEFLSNCYANLNQAADAFSSYITHYATPVVTGNVYANQNLLSYLGSSLKRLQQAFLTPSDLLETENTTIEEYKFSGQQFLLADKELSQTPFYAEYDMFLNPLLAGKDHTEQPLYTQLATNWQGLFTLAYQQAPVYQAYEQAINIEQTNLSPEQQAQYTANKVSALYQQVFTSLQGVHYLEQLGKLSLQQPSLLQQIQASIVEYTPFDTQRKYKFFSNNYTTNEQIQAPYLVHARGDDSFTVVQAHSRRRELEFAHDFILRQISQEQALGNEIKFSDFLIVAPNIDTYKATIEQFYAQLQAPEGNGQEQEVYTQLKQQNQLTFIPPYQILLNNLLEQEVSKLWDFIFKLKLNEFSYQDLQSWLSFAGTRELYKLEADDHKFLHNLLNNHQVNGQMGYGYNPLQINYAASNYQLPLHNQISELAHAEQQQDLPLLNYNSWQHLLFRASMQNSFTLDKPTLLTPAIPLLASSQTSERLHKFTSLMLDLSEYSSKVHALHTVEQWADFFGEITYRYLAHNETARNQAQAILREIKIKARQAEASNKLVDRFVFKDMLASVAKRIKSESFSNNKLTFATMAHTSGCSYKYVICLGLNHNDFPTQNTAQALDFTDKLKICSNNPNNYNLGQQDFLELLTNTRKKLVLSYIGKDAKDNDLPASSILMDVVDFIKANLVLPAHYLYPAQSANYESIDLVNSNIVGDDIKQAAPEVAASQVKRALATDLLSSFYSTPNDASFIKTLSLGSFALQNYGLAHTQLQAKIAQLVTREEAKEEDREEDRGKVNQDANLDYDQSSNSSKTAVDKLAQTLLQSAQPSFNQLWQRKNKASVSAQELEQQKQVQAPTESLVQEQAQGLAQESTPVAKQNSLNYDDLSSLLDIYQQIFNLSQQYQVLTYQEQAPIKAKFIDVSPKQLRDFATPTYASGADFKSITPDQRIPTLQKLTIYQNSASKDSIYGLPDFESSSLSFVFYGQILEPLKTGKTPEQIKQELILSGAKAVNKYVNNKQEDEFDILLEKYADYLQQGKPITALKTYLEQSNQAIVFPEVSRHEQVTEYLYYAVNAEFCHAYCDLLEQHPTLAQQQMLYQELQTIKQSQKETTQPFANVYLRIPVEINCVDEQVFFYKFTNHDKLIEYIKKEKLLRLNPNLFNPKLSDLCTLAAAHKHPRIKQATHLWFIDASESVKAGKDTTLGENLFVYYTQNQNFFASKDLYELILSYLAQISSWYLVGHNLFLPFATKFEGQFTKNNIYSVYLINLLKECFALEKYTDEELVKLLNDFVQQTQTIALYKTPSDKDASSTQEELFTKIKAGYQFD